MHSFSLPHKTSWPSFKALNICQFIGAMNDNLYKLLLVYCFIHLEGMKESTRILSFAGAIYVIPFLFLATTAGTLADRYSKRTIIIATRIVEVVALLLGWIALSLHNTELSYLVLLLLACHSSLFAPSKYGIVPEIVAKQDISKANGLLTLCTYTAVIIGTFLASFLTDCTHYDFRIAALFPLLFSSFALFISRNIQKTPPSGSCKKVSPKLVQELLTNIRLIRKTPPLLAAVLGSAFFLFAGSFIQLNIIPFAMECLNLTEVQGGYMFLLTALGIGIGSFLAGRISGKAIEFGLVPFGGFGLAISFFFLFHCSSNLFIVLPLFALMGLFGGFYLVPLDSYIQVASPPTSRGQIVATSNFFGFFGVFLSALLLYVSSNLLDLSPDKTFLLMGCIVLIAIFLLCISFAESIIRFYSFLLSSFVFPSVLRGVKQIPIDQSSFFFVPHSFFPWWPALLGCQRNTIYMISVGKGRPDSFLEKVCHKLLKVQYVDSFDSLYPGRNKAHVIMQSIERGASLAFFASKKDLLEHISCFKEAWKVFFEGKKTSFFQVIIPGRNSHFTENKKSHSSLVVHLSPVD